MPKILSEKQIAEYEENGLVFPVTVMSENDAKLLTRELETYEADSGGPIQKEWRHKVHLLFTWANEIVRHPKILIRGISIFHSLSYGMKNIFTQSNKGLKIKLLLFRKRSIEEWIKRTRLIG